MFFPTFLDLLCQNPDLVLSGIRDKSWETDFLCRFFIHDFYFNCVNKNDMFDTKIKRNKNSHVLTYILTKSLYTVRKGNERMQIIVCPEQQQELLIALNKSYKPLSMTC